MTTAVTPETNGAAAERADEIQRGGLLRRFVRDIRSLGELRHTPYGMGPAIVFGLIFFAQRFDTQVFYVAGPTLVRALDIKVLAIVNIIVVTGSVSIIALLGLGWYADRHARVPPLGIGTILSGIAAIASSRASTTATIGAPRVIDDASASAADVPSFSLIADYYPVEDRGRAFAFVGSTRHVAQIVGIAGAGLMVKYWGFRTTFVIGGAPLVLLGIYAMVRLKEPIRGYFDRKAIGADEEVARIEDPPQSFGEAWRTTFAVRTLRRLFVGEMLANGGDTLFIVFPFFLADKYGFDAVQIGLVLVPSFFFAFVGGVYGGGLVDRMSSRNPGRVVAVYGYYFILYAVGVLVIAFRPPTWLLMTSLCFTGFGGALIGPALNTVYSQVVPPSVRTQGLQVTRLSELPGFVLVGPLTGTILFLYGYKYVFLTAVPFYVIGGLVAISAGVFFETDRRNALAQSIAAEEWRRSKAGGNKKLLVCRNVDVAYDGVQVLFGVDFDVDEGEIIALLGTNGAGKSTLLRAISGSQEASGGAIVFDGRDTTHMPPHEIAAQGVVHMPGGRGVFPGLTVLENLLMGNWLSDDDADTRARTAEVFEIFPVLRQRADTAASLLSGGEQQMLSLAQAFLMRPKLLMIDELSLGLSPTMVGQLLDVLREIHKRGVTIVIVEQSVNVALNIADRAVFMEKGEVKFFGATADLLRRPDILRAVYVKGTGALTSGPPGAQRGARQRRELELRDAHAILEVDTAVKRFGGVTAVNGVSLTLREGEVLGLIGPNGSGKTTLLDLISGYQSIDEGRITFDGVDVTSWGPEQRARAGLIRRFQDARLFPSLTVSEALLIALDQRLEVKNTFLNAISLPRARRAERRLRAQAERLIELLSLQSYRDKFVKELSTGLRRIVDLGCVLAAEPKVLLLDEPSSGIAQREAEGLGPLLQRVRFETGCSILIIEHDMPLISAVADELLALDQGTPVLQGPPDLVLNDDRVIESYLGGSESALRRTGRSG